MGQGGGTDGIESAAFGATATIAAPGIGETFVFSATSAGSTPVAVTVAAAGTSVPTSLNLTPLLGGTLTVTARTKDAAGNLSATRTPMTRSSRMWRSRR